MKRLMVAMAFSAAPLAAYAGGGSGWDSNGNYYNWQTHGNTTSGWNSDGTYWSLQRNGNHVSGWDSNGNYYNYTEH